MVTAPLPWLQSLCCAVPALLLLLLLPGGMAGAGVGADALLINWSVQPVPGVGSALGPLFPTGVGFWGQGAPTRCLLLVPTLVLVFQCCFVQAGGEGDGIPLPWLSGSGSVQGVSLESLGSGWDISLCSFPSTPVTLLILCSSLLDKLERFKLSRVWEAAQGIPPGFL